LVTKVLLVLLEQLVKVDSRDQLVIPEIKDSKVQLDLLELLVVKAQLEQQVQLV
jgi:hypothetical protein